MSKFKIIVTSIFAVSIIVGIALFAIAKGPTSGPGSADLVVWGTISTEAFSTALQNSSINNSKDIRVTYVKKDVATFDTDLVEAIAEGSGPDIVILREDSVHKQRNKLFVIPYKYYTVRDFKDRFIEEGEMFLVPDGILGVPFLIDPMVMYWNRDLFSNASIAQTPQYWDQIPSIIEKITRRDDNANVFQSAVALGGWSNITHAKEIVAMLFIQAGTPITSRDGAKVVSVLNSQFNQPIVPSQSAINFYTQFSNPTGANYTWNNSLPSSLNHFLSEDLAMYLGFASEIFSIQQKNSNLNFDVTYVPQVRNAAKKSVFGHMYVLAIVKQSQQLDGAYYALNALTEPAAIKAMEKVTNLPPVRRDLLADKPTDAYRAVFYDSALISRSWIDPDPVASRNTFRDMIEGITSGRSKLTEALNRAEAELNAQLN